jgi:hypothetical protein
MKPIVRSQLVIVFKCLWWLSAIGLFVAFMSYEDSSSENEKYKTQGLVAEAMVYDRDQEMVRTEKKVGRKTTYSTRQDYKLYINYDKQSKVPYQSVAELDSKSQAELLPKAPADTDQTRGMMFVSESDFAQLTEGSRMTVVFVPWDVGNPKLLTEIKQYAATGYFVTMSVTAAMGVVFFLIARKLARG